MYSVNKSFPLESYQIIQPAESQTDFIPGNVIRFLIPRNIGYWDSHLSKAQFSVRTQGANYKMCFNSPYAGIASMIDMIRVSQNGNVISEILDYNQLQHMIKGYSLSLSGLQREAVQKGLVDFHVSDNTGYKALSSDCLCGQGLNRSGASGQAAMEQDVNFQLSLDFVSLFEVLEIVPSIALGDLLIEIRICPDINQIVKVLPASGVVHTLSTNFVDGDTSIALTPPFQGFTCAADSPFIVGQVVVASEAGVLGVNEYTITAIAEEAQTGIITLTIGAIDAADDNKTGVFIYKGANRTSPSVAAAEEAPTISNFYVSKAELQLQVVKPPPDYTMGIVNEVQQGQMFIDVDTYTTYKNTVLAGIKNQTLTLPTTQSRVKAFFTVLRRGGQSSVLSKYNDTDFDYDGVFGDLLNYRSQIDGIFYPNQPVSMAAMVGGWHFSQEHIRELEKAFDAAGLPLRTLLGVKQNTVIARALSAYGSSTNLTGTPINLYIDYNGQGPVSHSYPTSGISAVSGTGYISTAAPTVLATTGGSGVGMKVRAVVGAGAPFSITGYTIVEHGTGYVSGDVLTIPNPGGGITASVVGGGNTGYTPGPNADVPTTGGAGTGLLVSFTASGGGAVQDPITISNPGIGYATGNTLTITTGNANATFTLTIGAAGTLTLSKASIQCDAISFVHHTNRIAVSGMGIQVLN